MKHVLVGPWKMCLTREREQRMLGSRTRATSQGIHETREYNQFRHARDLPTHGHCAAGQPFFRKRKHLARKSDSSALMPYLRAASDTLHIRFAMHKDCSFKDAYAAIVRFQQCAYENVFKQRAYFR